MPKTKEKITSDYNVVGMKYDILKFVLSEPKKKSEITSHIKELSKNPKMVSNVITEINYLISSGYIKTSYYGNTKIFVANIRGIELLTNRGLL